MNQWTIWAFLKVLFSEVQSREVNLSSCLDETQDMHQLWRLIWFHGANPRAKACPVQSGEACWWVGKQWEMRPHPFPLSLLAPGWAWTHHRDKGAPRDCLPPHYLSCSAQSRSWQHLCQWRACLGCDREVGLQQPRAALTSASFHCQSWQSWHFKNGITPCTFSVSRLSLRMRTKQASHQPRDVRNIFPCPTLRLRHDFFLLLSAPLLCHDSIVATAQGSTKQQEQSWQSCRAAHAEHEFILQLLTGKQYQAYNATRNQNKIY